MACNSSSGEVYTYIVVNNIPVDYHAADLRIFFSRLVETNSFKCFHYRHRPEVKQPCKPNNNGETVTDSKRSSSRCCVAVVKEKILTSLLNQYHGQHWTNMKGEPMMHKCFISKVRLIEDNMVKDNTNTGLSSGILSRKDINKLAELHPPSIMPNGNVGTPSSLFQHMIRECRLPASIIGKLRLTFPGTKSRGKFSAVPPVYKTSKVVQTAGEVEELNSDPIGHTSEYNSDSIEKSMTSDDVGTEVRDSDDGEEWERHEALHTDEFMISRTKERLYEEPIELQWEKGGSGLVFYTDNYRWKKDEGDFDEQTADDWDVDMSAYYDLDPEAGDKDARDYLTMRRAERRRRGEMNDEDHIFKRNVGEFERHTKGVGRKIMERQGWKEGRGLGVGQAGMTDALENEGQPPYVKTGFGYRGEKLNRYPVRPPRQDVLISTVYDKPERLIKSDTLYQRHGEIVDNMTYFAEQYGVTTARTKFVKSTK